ncbi:MAG: bifunctional phosphopantothenoylcysteine decarboxylase/phosphopantothenate--cysteine ligase CoaBC [Candidatus Cloacimonadaceae bacterium]
MSNILLCVSGGIAAYKAIDLASQLKKAGHRVRTILTANAREFVQPINFSAITGESVHVSNFEDADPIPHITLADWADLVVIAPATANIIAKAVHGIADDLCSTTLLAHTKPKLWIPAMNVNMYQNPATQSNLATLKERGDHLLEPETGLLACGYEGKGKYPPNEELVAAVNCYWQYGRDLDGIKVLVTAGATEEAIDPMRKITNASTGKMGLAICRALALRGAEVTLVHGRMSSPPPYYLHETVFTPDVKSMLEAVIERSTKMDWIIKSAAVSDFTPAVKYDEKIEKSGDLTLELIPTPDILMTLGSMKPDQQKLIGFAAQTHDMLAKAKIKLQKKNLDMICANLLSTAGADDSQITIMRASDTSEDDYTVVSGLKHQVAYAIIDNIKAL